MKKLIFFLGFFMTSFLLLAQNNTSDEYLNRRWSGNLALGASIINPNYALSNVFKEYGFTDIEEGWLRDNTYPQKFRLPSFEIEFAYLIQKKMEVSGAFMISHGNIRGYDVTLNEKLEVSNTNFRFTPMLKFYSENYDTHLQVGPSINTGEFYRTNLNYQTVPFSTRYVRIGLMTGFGFSAIENSKSFLRVALNYHILPEKVAIGPFEYIENPTAVSKNQVTSTAIPREKILLQEVVIKVVYGFRFRTD